MCNSKGHLCTFVNSNGPIACYAFGKNKRGSRSSIEVEVLGSGWANVCFKESYPLDFSKLASAWGFVSGNMVKECPQLTKCGNHICVYKSKVPVRNYFSYDHSFFIEIEQL